MKNPYIPSEEDKNRKISQAECDANYKLMCKNHSICITGRIPISPTSTELVFEDGVKITVVHKAINNVK